MTEVRQAKSIKVYACGGAGINIAKLLSNYKQDTAGHARLDITYVDTSTSNLSAGVDSAKVYLLKDVDGSGKIRKENAEQISKSALNILNTHPPMDLNIVISSGSGGSGSVIAGTLVNQLNAKGQNTIVLMVGSTFTHIEAQNTLNSVKSLEAIATRSGVPVVMYYAENGEATPRKVVNEQMASVVNDLRVLFSGQNAELDSRDLANWLHYTKSTTVAAHLSALTIVGTEDVLRKNAGAIGNTHSVAILTADEADPAYPFYTEYRCNGFVHNELKEATKGQNPLYFVISDGPIANIVSDLTKTVQVMEEERKSRMQSNVVISGSENVTEDGLIL